MQGYKKDLWDATLYDRSHTFVSNYGQDLIELLQPQKGESILDVGCGTGDLAHMLFELGAQVVGVDKSANMIAQARSKYPHIPFNVVDATALPYDNTFDAVFSNATLHWIKSPKIVLEEIYRSLKNNGRFVAEFGGAGNVKSITDELINQIQQAGVPFHDEQFPWYFPSIGEYTSLLESIGFHVTFALHFDRPTALSGEEGLRNWLEMFSPSIFEHVTPETKEHIMTTTVQNLKEKLYKNNVWYADYKRLRIIASKPS